MSAEYCIAFISLIAIATLWSPSSSHSLALPCLFSCVLTPAHVLWIYPFALPFGLCLNLARIIALIPGLPLLSCPLDIVRRSPTTPVYLSTLLSCPLYTCLLFVRPCLLLTTPRNKSLQMDPHNSRLVDPVTEYSVKQGSSSFSEEHWPGMDTARILLTLKQGSRSLENYIREFLAIANYSDLPDCLLIEFFCDGINQPLQSELRREGPRSSLAPFMDYALLTVGSLLTVGVAEEEHGTAFMTEIAATLEHAHKMAATADPVHKMADTTTHRHFSADIREPSKVTVDRHESGQVTADVSESSQVTTDLHESSQVAADLKELSKVTIDVKEPSQVMDNLRESNQVTIDLPESHHVSADLPESHHVSADLPESHHVSADLPESCDVLSVTSRYSRSVLRFPSLVSSVRDAPLVSARAAGIPKPTHSSPPVPELIPLSEVLPMMGIAFWCVWAAYTTTEFPEVTVATMMSSEVAADAAEPPEVVAFVAMFPEVMVPAAVSPKVAADAAEPPEAAVLSSVPCMVVAPSNALSACHVTVEGTIAELSLYPDSTTAEPPTVAASAAEPSEVSVVLNYELSPCPITAKEAVYELSPCPAPAMEAVYDLSPCPAQAMEAVYESLSCPVTAMEAVYESLSCPVTTIEAICELLPCFELATEANNEPPLAHVTASYVLLSCPESAKEASCELPVPSFTTERVMGERLDCCVVPHVCPASPITAMESFYEPSVYLVIAKESISEQSVSPTTLKKANTKFIALSVTTQRPTCEPLNLPVMSPENINASHVCHVYSVTAIETTYELSPRPVSAHEPDYELSFCPMSASEPFDNLLVFSAMDALSLSYLSVFPRSQSLPWSSGLSALVWWSSALPGWPSAQVWWSSTLPWRFSALSPLHWWTPVPSAPPGRPSAPPWWVPVLSAPPWWAPVPSSLPWLPALPQSPVSPFPHGPGPPSLPLFRLRSTALLDCIGASGSRSLWGGSVTNPVCGLLPDSHQRSPLHHIDSLTSQHIGLHFPSSTALMTHTITQSLSPNHTLFISLGLSLCERRVLYCVYLSHSDSYSTEPKPKLKS